MSWMLPAVIWLRTRKASPASPVSTEAAALLGKRCFLHTTEEAWERSSPRTNGTYLSPWRVPIFSDALACGVTRLFEPWVRLRSSFPHSWFDAPGAVPNTRLRDQVEQETLVVSCCQTSGQPFSP